MMLFNVLHCHLVFHFCSTKAKPSTHIIHLSYTLYELIAGRSDSSEAIVPTQTPTVAPPSPVEPPTEDRFPCNICRGGTMITNFNAVLVTAFGTPVTCGQAQVFGATSGYTLEQCAIAQALAVGTCGCEGEPTVAPATSPTFPAPAPPPETVFCTVCFNGRPSNSNAGSIGGTLCSALDAQGRDNQFTSEQCLVIQSTSVDRFLLNLFHLFLSFWLLMRSRTAFTHIMLYVTSLSTSKIANGSFLHPSSSCCCDRRR
jgi:hypothetical protein